MQEVGKEMTKPSEARKIAHKLSKEISSHYIGMDDGSCEVEDWIEEALLSYGNKRFEEGWREALATARKFPWGPRHIKNIAPLLPKGKGE